MKRTGLLLVYTLFLWACKPNHKVEELNFKSEKVSRTATFEVNGSIETVFPLFGAFEERKWADGWNPTLIYPSTETMEEGTTFVTPGRDNEKEFLWRVSKYEPTHYLTQYLVSTENRYWTINVKCETVAADKTAVTVTYSYIGLNNLGNEINRQSAERMYSKNLTDWRDAINYFMSTGKVLKE